jgi:mannosyltransferase
MRTLLGEAGDTGDTTAVDGDDVTVGDDSSGDGARNGGGAFALVDRLSRALPSWLPTLAVAAVTAVGIGLRFFTPSKLWLDEALSLNIAQLPVGDLLEALRHDGHPPLYYLLLHYWADLVGDSDAAVRALSGIFAVATLPLAWVAGRRLAGTTGARWALVITALSPYAVRYATETRMYSLVMLLVLAGYLLLTDALRSPRPWRLAGLAVISGLLLLSHYWSFWLLASVGLVLAWRWWRAPGQRRTTTLVLGSLAAGGVLFLPWLPSFLYQSTHTGTPWGKPFRPTAMVQATLADMGGGTTLAEGTVGGFTLLLLCLLALFVARSEGRRLVLDLATTPAVRGELAVVAGTMAIGWLVAYTTGATFQSRYAAVVVPLILLAAAVGLSHLPRIGQVLLGGAVIALSFVGIGWTEYFERTQSEEVAAAIAGQAQPGDVVVYCPDQLGPAYSREMPDGLVELSYPELSSPERVDWVDYAERNAAADPQEIAAEVREIADGHAVFVVWRAEYRTFGQQCEDLIHAIGGGTAAETLVTMNSTRYYEPANVIWYPSTTP